MAEHAFLVLATQLVTSPMVAGKWQFNIEEIIMVPGQLATDLPKLQGIITAQNTTITSQSSEIEALNEQITSLQQQLAGQPPAVTVGGGAAPDPTLSTLFSKADEPAADWIHEFVVSNGPTQ